MLWLLVNNYVNRVGGDGCLRQFVPVEDVSRALANIYLQPVGSDGLVVDHDAPLTDVKGYKGVFTLSVFKRFLRVVGAYTTDKGVRRMWDDLSKDPMEVSEFLPRPEEQAFALPSKSRRHFAHRDSVESEWSTTNLFYLRVEMDELGLDPTRGDVIQINNMRVQLPKMLTSGMANDSLTVLFKMFLQVPVPDHVLEEVLEELQSSNRYGLIRCEDIARILTDCSLEGMSFELLCDLISKMQLDFPFRELKRMFDLMDFNNDKSLSLLELLGGFQVLFKQFLPLYVEEAVGVTVAKQLQLVCTTLAGLLLFFAFLGLAFASFNVRLETVTNAGSEIGNVLCDSVCFGFGWSCRTTESGHKRPR